MNQLEKILSFLQSFKMIKPTNYSWFHIVCLIITILITIILIYKKPSKKKTMLIISIIMVLFETYKQLSFSYSNGTWNYQWYGFPFQFCATPMYVALIAGLTKNKKIEECCYSFLATFGLIAGVSVMLYPNTVFVEEVLINIQTMQHHGFMVVMGTYILATHTVNRKYKEVIKEGFSVFLIFVAFALILDIVTYYLNIDGGLKMFFISPFHTSELPVFNIIYEKVPYIIFLLLYLFAFFLGGSIMYEFAKLIKNNIHRRPKWKKETYMMKTKN